jgi:predicted DNA-binding ribbon-helix-helix protein
MRTTLTIEDRIARDLKQIADRSGKAFKVVVNETLQAGLAARQEEPTAKRYRVRAVSLGGVRRGVDLDKALGLADSLEDEELAHQSELRK